MRMNVVDGLTKDSLQFQDKTMDGTNFNGEDFSSIENHPNFRQHMKHYRWRQFLKHFVTIWKKESDEFSDLWWKIRALVDDFNDVRKVLIKSSNRYCMDESMFGYWPQVLPTGNLPHITFEKDKPINLGPQVKVMGDVLLKAHLCLDLMEGKEANDL